MNHYTFSFEVRMSHEDYERYCVSEYQAECNHKVLPSWKLGKAFCRKLTSGTESRPSSRVPG